MYRKPADAPVKASPEMVDHMNAALKAGGIGRYHFSLNKRGTVTYFCGYGFGRGAYSCPRQEVEASTRGYLKKTIQQLADDALVATAEAAA